MRLILPFVLGALLLGPETASAQATLQGRPVAPGPLAVDSGPQILHVTDRLMGLPESRAALEAFHARKDAGLLPVAAKSQATVGTLQTFKVRNISTDQREDIDFTLVLERDRFKVWVETVHYPGTVTDEIVEQLRVALEDETPFGSINPAAGIIVNDEAYFGDPPDVDGDGKTDIMVLDVRDDCEVTDICVLGFFDPVDLNSTSPRDAVYLDVDPGLTSYGVQGVIQTAAHEFQHLIHAGYDLNEQAFVNEGLSEWAEILNGYRARAVTYLGDLAEQRVPLMSWAPQGEIGSVEDYQRAGLFTTYMAEQIGPVAAGSIAREPFDGTAGYDAVLNPLGIDLEELVRDFHVANHVNNRSILPEYGYSTAQYSGLSAVARTQITGTSTTSIPQTTLGPLPPGSVDYHVIEYLEDLNLRLYVPAGEINAALVPLRVRPVVVLFMDDGSVQAHEITIQASSRSFPGSIRRAVVVVPHVQMANPQVSLTYGMEATWSPAQVAYQAEAVAFDSGSPAELVCIPLGSVGRAANRFEIPSGSILSSVSVSVLYDSDCVGTVPPTSPRNYRLAVWAADGDVPAATPLFTLDRTDPRSSTIVTNGIDTLFVFDQVNLETYQAELSGLPSTVFISVQNAGSDANYLTYVLAELEPPTTTSPSFFYYQWQSGTGWLPFEDLSVGGRSLVDRALPIRATFLIPTADEDPIDLPREVTLEPAWPNPFNPSTTIAYSLPSAGPVRLHVFDVLGRRVATLTDGVMPAGRHEFRFDAGSLASGMYLYTVDTGRERISRTMLLVK